MWCSNLPKMLKDATLFFTEPQEITEAVFGQKLWLKQRQISEGCKPTLLLTFLLLPLDGNYDSRAFLRPSDRHAAFLAAYGKISFFFLDIFLISQQPSPNLGTVCCLRVCPPPLLWAVNPQPAQCILLSMCRGHKA